MATFPVGEHGRFFATRAYAGTLRGLVTDQLAGLPAGEPLELDFAGVLAITGAFADELVAGLVVEYGPRVTVAGADEDVAETIAVALGRRALA